MHDLVEILEHAFSLLDGFFQNIYDFIFYTNMSNVKNDKKDLLAWYIENLHEYFKKIKTIQEYYKMTRAVSQPGDADTSRTPGRNSHSVQTSINDHGVRFYLMPQ